MNRRLRPCVPNWPAILVAVSLSAAIAAATNAQQVHGTAGEPAVARRASASLQDHAAEETDVIVPDKPPAPSADSLDALLDQDLSALRKTSVAPALDVEVSTVARQQSTVGRSPAAVFVINQEMIRRSGARSVPELLRQVPGLHVARVDGNKWAVGSRGFNGRFSNKLLVQIDGRMVYSPLFAGVFWDVQDLLLEDIERIEVIRGPGATVWGANAVNGIINVITKKAADTQGLYAEAGGGTEERGFVGGRVGGTTAHGAAWRISGKAFDRDRLFEPNGLNYDATEQGRLSGRVDYDLTPCDQLTVQGDIYRGTSGTAVRPANGPLRFVDERFHGDNVLGRWTRTFDEESDLSVQAYYDHTDRVPAVLGQSIEIFDVDFQHRFPLCDGHQLIWGLGYRRISDNLPSLTVPPIISLNPVQRTVNFYSAFVQDEVKLVDDALYLTLGTKLLENDYTGFEIQPSVRLLWLPNEESAAWTAVSRAVRTPSRVEHDSRVNIGEVFPGVPITLAGTRAFESEELTAFEAGYRSQPVPYFSWDLAGFYNLYHGLANARLVAPFPPALTFSNGMQGRSYGAEISGNVDMTACWRVAAWFAWLHVDLTAEPGSQVDPQLTEGSAPLHQAFVRSSWDIACDWQVDLFVRYVDAVLSENVPHYWSLDARLAWQPTAQTELSVVGQNLLDTTHPEYGTNIFNGEIATFVQRGVYGMASWKY